MNIQAAPSPRLYTRPPLGIKRVIEYAQAGAAFIGGRYYALPHFEDTATATTAFVSGSYQQTYFPPGPVDGPPQSDTATAQAAFLGGSYVQSYFPPGPVDGTPQSETVNAAAVLVSGSYTQTYFPPVPIDRAFSETTHAAASFVSGRYYNPSV